MSSLSDRFRRFPARNCRNNVRTTSSRGVVRRHGGRHAAGQKPGLNGSSGGGVVRQCTINCINACCHTRAAAGTGSAPGTATPGVHVDVPTYPQSRRRFAVARAGRCRKRDADRAPCRRGGHGAARLASPPGTGRTNQAVRALLSSVRRLDVSQPCLKDHEAVLLQMVV